MYFLMEAKPSTEGRYFSPASMRKTKLIALAIHLLAANDASDLSSFNKHPIDCTYPALSFWPFLTFLLPCPLTKLQSKRMKEKTQAEQITCRNM